MEELSIGQYNLVANFFSFTIAAMGAATAFLWINRSQVAPAYRTAITVSGVVTLIAFYHYWRIYGSWMGAYEVVDGALVATGKSFNDAYRYVDWLLTVPLLLVELILVMRLSPSETTSKAFRLGGLAALMIILGYPGEISSDDGTRWLWWALSMVPFVWIVFELFVGLRDAQNSQPAAAKKIVGNARFLVLLSWSFYPIVFLFPMIGIDGPTAQTILQIGYTIADVVAKAVFGILIFAIAMKKSESEPQPAAA